MRGIFTITISLIIIVFFSCNPDKNTNGPVSETNTLLWPDSTLAAKIRDTLRTFPFIKKAQRYFDSVTNNKQGVTFTMDTLKGNVYPIAVFYVEEEQHFQKLYRFEVNPRTMEIKVNDINTGEFITIEEYYKLAP